MAYHPRRSLQGVQHVDQSALTSGLSFTLQVAQPPTRVYLAPEAPLPYTLEGSSLRVELPPTGPHAVVVVE